MPRKAKEKKPIQITATLYKGEVKETLVEEINKYDKASDDWTVVDTDLIWEIFEVETTNDSFEFHNYIFKIRNFIFKFIKARYVGNEIGIFSEKWIQDGNRRYPFNQPYLTKKELDLKLWRDLINDFGEYTSKTRTLAISPQVLEFIRATKCDEKLLEQVETLIQQIEEKFPKYEKYNWIISRFWQNHRSKNEKDLEKEIISFSVRFLPCFVNDFLQEYYSYLVSIGELRDFTPNKMKLRNTLVKIIFDLRKEFPEITYGQMKKVGTEYENINYTPEFTAENIANQIKIYNKTEIGKAMRTPEYLFNDEKMKEIKAEIKEKFIRWVYSLRSNSKSKN